MKEKIIDHLTMKHLTAGKFSSSDNQKIRTAHILAKKDYEKLTEQQRQNILNTINKEEE